VQDARKDPKGTKTFIQELKCEEKQKFYK